MGLWSFYFFAKLGLFYSKHIGFHLWENLAFAIVLAIPLENSRWRTARHILAVPVALALLYYDSWLPSFSRLISQADALAGFSGAYLLELIGRFINPGVVAALAGLFVVCWLLGRKLRLATFVFLGVFSVPLTAQWLELAAAPTAPSAGPLAAEAPAANMTPEAKLAAFYEAEKRRQVNFVTAAETPAFDVIYLHVCSLSWDDLAFLNAQDHPLLKRFDFLFKNFNSAASYSGPSAVRLLKSSCGQPSHQALYKNETGQCQLFRNFQQVGYDAQALLNHDGRYDNFIGQLENDGGFSHKVSVPQGLPAAMHSFDGTPIFGDLAVLSRWWRERENQPGGPVALYYNTVTLHDGNRLPGVKSFSSLETYKPRLLKLLDNLDQFISQLEASGRPVVVVLVGEHGAALRGDRVQISGLREIPSPRISLVPAAVKLIGMPGGGGPTLSIDTPTSYLALTTLVSSLMSGVSTDKQALVEALPGTDFVSENDNILVMKTGVSYQMRSPDGVWMDYTD